MYKIKEKMPYKIGFLMSMFILCVIATITFAGLFFYNLFIKLSVNKAIETTYIEENYETNNDNEKVYKPIYHYEVNGVEYKCKSSIKIKGEKLTEGIVHYNSSNPKTCMIDNDYSNFIIFYVFLIPAILFAILLIPLTKELVRQKKRKKMVENLIKNGILVKNIPHEIEHHYGIDPSNSLIVSEYKFPDGTVKKLKSEPLSYRRIKKGSKDLLYDPNNYDNYYLGIDIEKIN